MSTAIILLAMGIFAFIVVIRIGQVEAKIDEWAAEIQRIAESRKS